MNNNEKMMLKKELSDIKKLNINQILLMLKYSIEAYLHSIISFGPRHEITLEVKEIWYKFRQIMKEEKKIYEFILRNSSSIYSKEVYDLLDKIEELNDETIEYFYAAFDDILDACETKCENRATHYKKEFLTLIETDEYRIQASGLTVSFENIKEFLCYPQTFWDYVASRIRRVDPRIKENEILYVTLIKTEENGTLKDFKVYVPEIVDLKTACINVHEFKHAYDLYLQMGKIIDETEEHYEKDAEELEKEFQKRYVLKRYYEK